MCWMCDARIGFILLVFFFSWYGYYRNTEILCAFDIRLGQNMI